jgi:hypothetical protein
MGSSKHKERASKLKSFPKLSFATGIGSEDIQTMSSTSSGITVSSSFQTSSIKRDSHGRCVNPTAKERPSWATYTGPEREVLGSSLGREGEKTDVPSVRKTKIDAAAASRFALTPTMVLSERNAT